MTGFPLSTRDVARNKNIDIGNGICECSHGINSHVIEVDLFNPTQHNYAVRECTECDCKKFEYTEKRLNDNWKRAYRPGYFGRRRDAIVGELNDRYGAGNWKLMWSLNGDDLEFADACHHFYGLSYTIWFLDHPDDLDFVCSFGECIDNAMSNIESGCDYTHQEAFSTHIQDIAVRNVLKFCNRRFEGPKDKILVIRSADSAGFRYGPGNIPFLAPELIEYPSKAPRWANPGSVEDFWQSNRWVWVRE